MVNLPSQVDQHHMHMNKCMDQGCHNHQLFALSKAIMNNSKTSYTSLDQCLDHSLTPELFPIADLIQGQPKQKGRKPLITNPLPSCI